MKIRAPRARRSSDPGRPEGLSAFIGTGPTCDVMNSEYRYATGLREFTLVFSSRLVIRFECLLPGPYRPGDAGEFIGDRAGGLVVPDALLQLAGPVL